MLELDNISKNYKNGLFNTHARCVVDRVSLQLHRGEILGLCGDSGCGKSTIARIAAKLLKPTDGRILLNGLDITKYNDRAMKKYRNSLQIIFQHPEQAFNPQFTIKASIYEGFDRIGIAKTERMNLLVKMADLVNFPMDLIERRPIQVSGGEIQRAVLVRALAFHPEFLILDEPTSMLDVSVQAYILNVIREIREKENIGVLLISHDMDILRVMCDRILIMKKGQIVKSGTTAELFSPPKISQIKNK